MHHIIPAIIPTSSKLLHDALMTVKPFTRDVQVDVVDGIFVPFRSWPYIGSGSVNLLQHYTDEFKIEIDLMIQNPETVIGRYADAGATSLVVHLESTHNLESIFEHYENNAYALGLSIDNDTSLSLLTPHIERVDYVQLMGIAQIGSQGQPFDARVLDRIRTLRGLYPDLMISIDGSVNATSLPLLKEAGANRFVSGSAIFAALDPGKAFTALERFV